MPSIRSANPARAAREMIVSMVKEGRTAAWLEGLGIDVDERTLNDTVEQAIIRVTEGKKLSAPPVRPEERKRRMRRGVSMAGVSQTSIKEPVVEAAEPSAYEPEPTEEEQAQRVEEDRARAEELAGRNRVNQFLRRRLNSMYPGLSHEERAEIDKMSQVIMEGKGEEEGEDRAKRVYRV
jgi:hypothetical protein